MTIAATSRSTSANQPFSDTPDGFSAINSEEFMRIIFAELSRQDPTQPSDSSKLIEQLSSIRSIQSDIELSRDLKSIVGQSQFATAGGLIGKQVQGLTDRGERVSGKVTSVSNTSIGPVLNLESGQRLAFTNVDRILENPPAQPPSTTTPPTGGAGGTNARPTTTSTPGSTLVKPA
jgi:flagellar basal-body rod modification protein FlgD